MGDTSEDAAAVQVDVEEHKSRPILTLQQLPTAEDTVWAQKPNYAFPEIKAEKYGPEEIPNLDLTDVRHMIQTKIAKQRKRWEKFLALHGENELISQNLNDSKENGSTKTVTPLIKQLKKLTRKGVPPEFRGQVWFLLSGAAAQKRKWDSTVKSSSSSVTYYQSLIERNETTATPITYEADKDVDRTFPEHPYFSQDSIGRNKLRRLLYMHSFHCPQLGYCQSMNFVAAILLLNMDEERAFWTFNTILESYMPDDLYTGVLPGLHVELHVLDTLLKQYAPRLHHKLAQNQVDVAMFATEWFLCYFVNAFPIETAMRVWDSFVFEGYKVLFRTAVAFLKLCENELVAAPSFGEIVQIVSTRCARMHDCRKLIKSSFRIRKFSRAAIIRSRHEWRSAMTIHGKSVTFNSPSGSNINGARRR